jgi:hypothetical protein
MITDLRDLERLLGQYDRRLILVGPVLGFSIDDYRYFYVAASGSKVYETIGLGVFENEADAENQRANIIAILKDCFEEMLIFDSHLEMAHAADTRWSNEETAKVLALASLLTEHKSDAIIPDASSEDSSHAHEAQRDYGQGSFGDSAQEVNSANEAVPPSVVPRAGDEAKPSQSPSPQIMSLGAPSSSSNDDRPAATPQPVHSGRNDEDISAISRALTPSYHQGAATSPAAPTISAVGGDRVVKEQQGRSERKGDLLAIMASFTRPDLNQDEVAEISRAIDPPDRARSIPWFSLENFRGLAFLVVLMFVVGGATAFLTWTVFYPSTPRMEHDVGTIKAPQLADASAPSSIHTQQTGSITPPQVGSEQRTEVNEPTRRSESAPTAVAPSPPAPPSSGGISPQAKIRSDTGSAGQPMTNAPTQQVEPAPTVMAPSAPAAQPSGGVSAQARAKSDSIPQQQVTTGVPTRQVEPVPTVVAPSPSGRAITQTEAVPNATPEQQTRTASVSGPQSPPAQGTTALSPETQEITTLIERGTDFLKRGDLASARLFLRRAAEAGSADAALKLGSTFDPSFIQQLGVIGVAPDVARARQWYEKAAELGSDAASQRLAALKKQ